MTVLDEIGQKRRWISDRLMQLDVERQKLSDQLHELETAERVLNGFGSKAVTAGNGTKAPPARKATAASDKRRAGSRQEDSNLSLSDASLKAVQAHRKGASASDVLEYLTREFGMTVRANHLGMALQRHRRAG